MTEPALDVRDRLRLSEAFRLARIARPAVWPGWEATPFPVLLVGDDAEWFVGEAEPPDGFKDGGWCPILERDVWTRPRHFEPQVTAAFPAFGQQPVVVIGRAEATGRGSTEWVLTVMHEHFHTYQMGEPGYGLAVDALALSGGDSDAMWMLNYAFPYGSREVARAFTVASNALWRALQERADDDFRPAYARLLDVLSEPDRRYLSFQLWQEGVARYVELRVGEVVAQRSAASRRFQELPDARSFQAVTDEMRSGILTGLEHADLEAGGRRSFYAFGAGLALLLDERDPAWKGRYMTERFSLFGGGA